MKTAGTLSLTTELQQAITSEQAWFFRMVPKAISDSQLEAFIDEEHRRDDTEMQLEMLFGREVRLESVPGEWVREALTRYYRRNATGSEVKSARLQGRKAESFLEDVIAEARELGSSDIHFEVYETGCRVRIRIDGQMIERYTIDRSDYPALVNKVKIKARLDIAEKRLPQDGRIFFTYNNRKIDIRVSVLPTLHGEKIVLRLLNSDASAIDLEQLGMSETEMSHYLEGVKRPNGIVLISGPTGSGKTTTLYATLKLLNQPTTNILTVEDPIEYTLKGINQVQVRENIGLTFAGALRSFLRQDPDIIMLGEIRDGETANMAIRAALTGHLVLSTIHTNSAWGTVSRLIDMGVPPFLLAGTLNTTVAQRLVRLLCPDCKEAKPFDPNTLPRNFQPPSQPNEAYFPAGCSNCYYTGYRGRKAVYEIIPVDRDLATHIRTQQLDVEELLATQKIARLQDSAFSLFARGLTSAEEVYPILSTTL